MVTRFHEAAWYMFPNKCVETVNFTVHIVYLSVVFLGCKLGTLICASPEPILFDNRFGAPKN
jgi:hypothetical protein